MLGLQETMTHQGEKVAVEPENVFERPRESDSPSYQKRQKMALSARTEGAGDGGIGRSAMSTEKEYEKIFKLLEGVQGPIEIKKQFFESNIKEAARYVRGDLIPHLEKKLEEMTSGYLSKKEHQTLNA
ncbi:cancer/testis antigen family 45 member A3-like isoform X2 [Callithrix jacchus]